MKKNLYLTSLLCGFVAYSTISCENPGEPQFENDQYKSVLFLDNSGQQKVDYYNTNKELVYTTSIGKGGTDPEIARNATLRVFTQEEMNIYNEENLTDFKILPTDCYEYTTKYAFETKTEKQEVNITLKPNIFLLGNKSQYVLPLRLTSPVYGVNEVNDELILIPNLITPTLSLSDAGIKELTIPETEMETQLFTTPVSLSVPNQNWDFSVELERERDILQSLVDRYSAESGIIYKLLPIANYTLPAEVLFSGSGNTQDLYVNIKNTNLKKFTRYLLPVVIKECSGMPFEIDGVNNTCFLQVVVSGELTKQELNVNQLSSNETYDKGNFNKLVDNDPETSWQSRWEKSQQPTMELPPFDRTYGIYFDIDNIDIQNALQLEVAIKTTHNLPTEWSIYKKENDGSFTKLGETYTNTFSSTQKAFKTNVLMSGACSAIRIAFTKTNNSNGSSLTNPVWKDGKNCGNINLAEITLFGE